MNLGGSVSNRHRLGGSLPIADGSFHELGEKGRGQIFQRPKLVLSNVEVPDGVLGVFGNGGVVPHHLLVKVADPFQPIPVGEALFGSIGVFEEHLQELGPGIHVGTAQAVHLAAIQILRVRHHAHHRRDEIADPKWLKLASLSTGEI